MTDAEKQQAQNLLNELESKGPEELPDWNIKAQSFLVFMAAKYPEIVESEE